MFCLQTNKNFVSKLSTSQTRDTLKSQEYQLHFINNNKL